MVEKFANEDTNHSRTISIDGSDHVVKKRCLLNKGSIFSTYHLLLALFASYFLKLYNMVQISMPI